MNLDSVRKACGPNWIIEAHPNYWHEHAELKTWEETLEAGRSYMVGTTTPMANFIKSHQFPLTAWQREAYKWAREHPDQKLVLYTWNRKRWWEVYVRGEFVEMGLPYHDAGGEHYYVSRDGKTKVYIDAD